MQHNDNWDIYIQLPYVRKYIGISKPSEKAAMTSLRKFVHSNMAELKEFALISDLYNKARKTVRDYHADGSVDKATKVINSFLNELNGKKWYTARGSFTKETMEKI